MKVLWFSLTPCGSIRKENKKVTHGSWMISLEDELKIREGLSLEVAYFSESPESPFVYNKVKYYPLCRNLFNNRKAISRIIERFIPQSRIDRRTLPLILEVVRQSMPDIIHIQGTEESFGLITKQSVTL